MSVFKKHLGRIFLFILVTVFSAQTQSANMDEDWVSTAEMKLITWQDSLDNWRVNPPTLGQLETRQNEVFSLKQKSENCVADLTDHMSLLLKKLNALGEATENESQDIKKRRLELSEAKGQAETKLVVCRLLSLGVNELQADYKILRNKLLSQALSHRESPVWESLFSLLKNPAFIASGYQIEFSFWPSSLLGLIVVLVFTPISRYISGKLHQHFPVSDNDSTHAVVSAMASMYSRRLSWVVVLSGFSLFAYFGGLKLLGAILLALIIAILLAPLLELFICQNIKKCREGFPARILLDIVLVGLVVYFSGLNEWMTIDGFAVLRSGYYFIVMLLSLWLLFLLVKREDFQILNSIRTPLAIAIVAGPVSMFLGYKSLAELLISGIYGTMAGFLIVWSVYQAGSFLFNMFESEHPQTNSNLRHFLGYDGKEAIPGIWIGRLLLIFSIGVVLLYWLLVVWNIPHSEINIIKSYFTKGFPVGAITVVPSKIIGAVLAFFLLMTLARWLRNQLADRWLQKTRLDAGARESIVSLTTYTIVGIALAIALGMAGVEFQNIAIVAGALSVGIGFGLQNIVNNFVSGLILLFERPVKPGDWVVVGATEGYVKKISIRYTLIQTFDRADVLVPNSELISSQVTNWMLRDSLGRVIVPISVAYGSDTKLVREILYRVAAAHPLVLVNDWRVSSPKIMFMEFGDSSLNFEVRCFIQDIDFRLSVRSDLLFSIDEEFRNAGVEIPFPQRVVHMAEDEQKVIQGNITGEDKGEK